jgi:hypothetical protein
MEAKYRCTVKGPRNNGLLKTCGFEFVFEEGTHNCPKCGQGLTQVSIGKSVTELLQEGFRKAKDSDT